MDIFFKNQDIEAYKNRLETIEAIHRAMIWNGSKDRKMANQSDRFDFVKTDFMPRTISRIAKARRVYLSPTKPVRYVPRAAPPSPETAKYATVFHFICFLKA